MSNHQSSVHLQHRNGNILYSAEKLAKTVMVKADGKMAMAVLPASYKVILIFKRQRGQVRLNRRREEFKGLFPGCRLAHAAFW
jgi:Ala-tRNA(Pro) deacylase